jgi:hypothetical protein
MGLSPLIVASVLEPGALAGLVRDALREAGADPVTPTNGLRAWDGIVHDCAPAAACAIEGILASSRDDVAVPILVVASDSDRVRRLLGQSAGMGTLRWVQPGEQDVEHRLDAAVRQLVEQAAAARVHRILALARPGLPRAVHAVSRAFLNRLAEDRRVPTVAVLLRQAGIPPRTAERTWSRAGLSTPERFLGRLLLMFLAIDSARTGQPLSRVAQHLGVAPKTLRRLRERAPCLRTLRDLYDDAGVAALARCASNGPSDSRDPARSLIPAPEDPARRS